MKVNGQTFNYVLMVRENGMNFYWKYGATGGWTQDLNDARRYELENSARSARQHLLKRPDMNPDLIIEPILDTPT